jgi:AhpD family alkylhydroperoxidase
MNEATPPRGSIMSSFVPQKPLKKYSLFTRLLLRSQKRRFGQHLIPTMQWGKLPVLLGFFTGFYLYFNRKSSHLEPRMRSLVMLRVAQINWCNFCIDLNSLILIERSGSQDLVNELENWHHSTLLSEKEKAALSYCEEMTDSNKKVSDKTREKLKSLFKSDDIVELTALIAYQNMSAKFNSALDLPNQGLCLRKK